MSEPATRDMIGRIKARINALENKDPGGPFVKKSVDTMTGNLTSPNYISNVAIGTQPYACTSTTKNTNLHADSVDSVHVDTLTDTKLLRYESASQKIQSSSITETAGSLSGITAIEMSSKLTNTLATGSPPFAVSSTTMNPNLNADMLDDQHGSYYATDSLAAHLAGTETFTGEKSFTTLLYIVGAANATIQTANPAIRKATAAGALHLDSPAGIIINIDTNNDSTTAQFGVRANASTSPIFSINENIPLGGTGITGAVPPVTIGADQAANFYNMVSSLSYNQNYSLTASGDYVPNLMGMWFYTNLNSGFSSGKTIAESTGMGGIHLFNGATGTVTKGHSMLGWIWSTSGTMTTAQNFTARTVMSAATGITTAITTLRGFTVENLINSGGAGTVTLPTKHEGFYCENLTLATNNYQIYLENETDTTNDWAIYSLGGRSSHLGSFAFGSNTAPAYTVDVTGDVNVAAANTYRSGGTAGVSGSFTTTDLKTVTVTKGIVTAIV